MGFFKHAFIVFAVGAMPSLPFLLFPVPSEVEMCEMHPGLTMAAMMQDPAEPGQEAPPQDPPASQDPPNEEPPLGNPNHIEPTEYCRPTSIDGKMPCMCLKYHQEGCFEGRRETEHRVCMSYCWKNFCSCCNS